MFILNLPTLQVSDEDRATCISPYPDGVGQGIDGWLFADSTHLAVPVSSMVITSGFFLICLYGQTAFQC